MQDIFEKIVQTERYKNNILYGEPRRGHAEGTVAAHIAELQKNLDSLYSSGVVKFEYYWKLKILIHVHDSFKAESKRNAAIEDPQSHASLARTFLSQYTDDSDMLAIVQYHDLGYAVYRKLKSTGRMDNDRLRRGLEQIEDKDLFLLFCIIDSCTESKGREMIQWFIGEVNGMYSTNIHQEHILPGEATIAGAW